MKKVAVAHDQFSTFGGAERVASEIARMYDAPIYVMEKSEDVVPDDINVVDVSSRVGGFMMSRHHIVQDMYQMLAWQFVPELHEADVVIETKTNPYWYVPRDTQPVVRYCHSTPRGMYDQFHRRGNGLRQAVMGTAMRALFSQVVPYANTWVANSDLVAKRLERYMGVEETSVVYPGVDTGSFGAGRQETGDYLLHVGRLAVNKRVGLIRKVAEEVNMRVVVAGEGPCKDELLDGAPGNLDYLGYVDEERKRDLLSGAAATLFLAENEDFGIVPIESFASGTPVIGVDEGFTRHQVQDGLNGLLCKPDVQEVTAAVGVLERYGVEWGPRSMEEYASQFDWTLFRRGIASAVEDAVADAEVNNSITGAGQ